jgi:hypothetical protein
VVLQVSEKVASFLVVHPLHSLKRVIEAKSEELANPRFGEEEKEIDK